jgi:hypothetical protein
MIRTMKTCGRCHQSKPLSEFYRKPRKSGGVTVYCKPCFNAYTTERFRLRKKQAVEYLGGRCGDCGGIFPYYVYDFHHLDPSQKDVQFTVLRRRSWEAITRELDKCVLLCSNCHRIRHWDKFDHEVRTIP